jgi:hypothetical protein
MKRLTSPGADMVVTEWQLDLDAEFDAPAAAEALHPAGRAPDDPAPAFEAHGPAIWSWAAHEREQAHVALEIDPADEGATQP